MIRTVLIAPNPELDRVSDPVDVIDDHALQVLDDLVDTMLDCTQEGLGFAAPQIGVPRRLAVFAFEVDDDGLVTSKPGSILKLVNPRIVQRSAETHFLDGGEGCFSVPGVEIRVERSRHVVVEAQLPDGEPITLSAKDLEAVVFQHELDHFEGKTLYSRFSRQQRRLYARRNNLKGSTKRRKAVRR